MITFSAITLLCAWVLFVCAQMLGAGFPRWAVIVAAIVGILGALGVGFGL